jgi:hypothetical protein
MLANIAGQEQDIARCNSHSCSSRRSSGRAGGSRQQGPGSRWDKRLAADI